MPDVDIVFTARTPIAKAYRGAYNELADSSVGAVPVAEAMRRAGVDADEVDDCIFGCVLQQGVTGFNIARQIALAAGLPITVAGMTVDRQCSSGLMAIATAAKQVLDDGMSVVIAGGIESISLVQTEETNKHLTVDEALLERFPAMNMPVLDTAEVMARRYGIGRDLQDAYGLESRSTTSTYGN